MPKWPAEYEKDLNKAISLLKELGCTEIYIFGSLANDTSFSSFLYESGEMIRVA